MKRTICILLATLLCLSLSAEGLGLKTVVIDAGHGGKDPGAVSKDKKTYEKNITLDIAQKLAAKIKEGYPDVKVLLTRSKDVAVDLADRAEKANKANADLFISIHINSEAGTAASGFSVHILGQSSNKNRDLFAQNMAMVQRENSVILLEDDYSTKYEGIDPSDPESYIFMLLMQNSNLEQSFKFAQMANRHLAGGPVKANRGLSQDPFYVLWKTSMPSVLVELGFISNQSDLAALRREEGRQGLADRLYLAFKEYKASYDHSVSADAQDNDAPVKTEVKAPKKEESQSPAPAAAVAQAEYGIQIFASTKKVDPSSSAFMGYKVRVVGNGKLNKYVIALSGTEAEAKKKLASVRAKYPDAFAVKIVDNDTVRLK